MASSALVNHGKELEGAVRHSRLSRGGPRRAPDEAERLQLIGQRAEQQVDRLVSDLHIPECNRAGC